MISGHIGAGHYILFQRDPRTAGSPLLEVGRLVVIPVDSDTRIEHWFLYTSSTLGSGYAAYIRPHSALAGIRVGLVFRGAGGVPNGFNPNDYMGSITLSTGCSIEYIEAHCDRLGSNNAGSSSIAAAMPSQPHQIDLGVYDIMQRERRVGVVVVTPSSGGTLESWHLFDRVPPTTITEGAYLAPDSMIGGSYALMYLGSVSTPDLSGRAIVTVNAICATAA